VQPIIVRLIVLFGFILLGHIAVCNAQTPAGIEVTIVGNTLEKMEKAIEGIDYIRDRSGIRSLEGQSLLYDPAREQYNLMRRFVVVKEAHDGKGQPLSDLEGRQLRVMGEKSAETDRLGGKEISLSGILRCDKSLVVASVSEVQQPPPSEVCTCKKLSFDGPQCTYRSDSETLEVGHERRTLEQTVVASGHTDCPPPDITGSCGWAKVTLKDWKDNRGVLTIEVSANESVLSRSARFDVDNRLLLVQEGVRCIVRRIDKDPATLAARAAKVALEVSVSPSDCRWVLASRDPWIRVSQETYCGDAVALYSVTENETPFPRVGAIRIVLASDGATGATIEINQER
jgi:hypothetical protein